MLAGEEKCWATRSAARKPTSASAQLRLMDTACIYVCTCTYTWRHVTLAGVAAADHVLALQPSVQVPTCFLCILRICSEPANSLPLRQDRLSNSEPAPHRTSLGGLSETTCLLTVRSEVNKFATRQRAGKWRSTWRRSSRFGVPYND